MVPFWRSVQRAKCALSDGTLPFWKPGQNTDLHVLLRMSISIWTCFVLSQRSLLLTLSIHCIPNIFRKHWFTKVWILFSVVLFIRQVSAPYSNTNLLDICVEQTYFRCFADYPGLPHIYQNVECCPCFADSCFYVSLCPSSCVHYTSPGQPAARGPHAARQPHPCGPPGSTANGVKICIFN